MKVYAQVIGGTPKEVDVETVAEAKAALGLTGNYTATVNGEPADLDEDLEDFNVVIFTQSVKGG